MRECPWCGRINLNVYAYCQGCGRGFAELEPARTGTFQDTNMGMWLAGTSPAAGLPAFWPIAGALAAFLFGAALLWAQQSDNEMGGPLIGASGAVLAVAVVAWLAANAAGAKIAAHPASGERHLQVVLVEAPDEARAGALAAWLKRPRELRALAGIAGVEVPASEHPHGTQTLIRLELEGEKGPERANLERILRAHAGSGARVELFPPQMMPETRQPRVRMGVAAAATLVGGLLIGGIALAGTYAGLSGEGGGTPAGPTEPAGFDGTVVARSNTFMTESMTLPPATAVTLRIDNRDAGVLHNIAFYPGEETTGAYLEGCTAGCDKDGTAVRTTIAAGPVVQEFTFTTPGPGRYGYICEIHPTTMKGVLDVAEGASPPV